MKAVVRETVAVEPKEVVMGINFLQTYILFLYSGPHNLRFFYLFLFSHEKKYTVGHCCEPNLRPAYPSLNQLMFMVVDSQSFWNSDIKCPRYSMLSPISWMAAMYLKK